MLKSAFLASAVLCAAAPASAAVIVSYEDQGTVNTTVAGTFAVETFDNDALGFKRNFTDVIAASSNSHVGFTYAGVDVREHDQFGGNGSGNYGATYNGIGFAADEGPSYSLDVASTTGSVNFFGAYFTATDATNTVSFYKGATLIQTFQIGDLWDAAGIGNQGSVYIDFKFTGGQTYDKIAFDQPNSPYGFETDNHTVGTLATLPGGDNSTLGVPEPATWAMIVGGFGLMGAAMRRRRGSTTFA